MNNAGPIPNTQTFLKKYLIPVDGTGVGNISFEE